MLSAGICLYNATFDKILLVKPGGPYFVNSQTKPVWGFPKGHVEEGEDVALAALREFGEETGWTLEYFAPVEGPTKLGRLKQNATKVVEVYLVVTHNTLPLPEVKSNTCALEWPKGSGVMIQIPEVDTAKWVSFEEAEHIMIKGQKPFLELLSKAIGRQER
jgi:predicted NUDIX family NTP pyrophosphohydrolase